MLRVSRRAQEVCIHVGNNISPLMLSRTELLEHYEWSGTEEVCVMWLCLKHNQLLPNVRNNTPAHNCMIVSIYSSWVYLISGTAGFTKLCHYA